MSDFCPKRSENGKKIRNCSSYSQTPARRHDGQAFLTDRIGGGGTGPLSVMEFSSHCWNQHGHYLFSWHLFRLLYRKAAGMDKGDSGCYSDAAACPAANSGRFSSAAASWPQTAAGSFFSSAFEPAADDDLVVGGLCYFSSDLSADVPDLPRRF